MFSMLLKMIVVEWFKMVRHNTHFEYAKVWQRFWSRAERSWRELASDKEYELRNIAQRNSNTWSTWVGINKQMRPLGKIDRGSFRVTCKIDWRLHEKY